MSLNDDTRRSIIIGSGIDKLEAEIALYKKRLEAIIKYRWRFAFLPSHKAGPWHVWQPGDPSEEVVAVGHGETPEEALDAAIASTREKPRGKSHERHTQT